jgi:hypothetical protein
LVFDAFRGTIVSASAAVLQQSALKTAPASRKAI